MNGTDRLRASRVGTDRSPPCEHCGNAVGQNVSLCVRCTRAFGLDAAHAGYRLDIEIRRELACREE